MARVYLTEEELRAVRFDVIEYRRRILEPGLRLAAVYYGRGSQLDGTVILEFVQNYMHYLEDEGD